MAQNPNSIDADIDGLMDEFLKLDISSQEDTKVAEQLAALEDHVKMFLEAVKAADQDISTLFISVLKESQSGILPKPQVYQRIMKKFEEHNRLDLAVWWWVMMPQEWIKSNATGSDGEEILYVQMLGREKEVCGTFPKAGRTNLPK